MKVIPETRREHYNGVMTKAKITPSLLPPKKIKNQENKKERKKERKKKKEQGAWSETTHL